MTGAETTFARADRWALRLRLRVGEAVVRCSAKRRQSGREQWTWARRPERYGRQDSNNNRLTISGEEAHPQ